MSVDVCVRVCVCGGLSLASSENLAATSCFAAFSSEETFFDSMKSEPRQSRLRDVRERYSTFPGLESLKILK